MFIFLGCGFHEHFDIKPMKIILNKRDVQHEAQGNRIRGSVQKEDVLYPISFERYSALGQFKKLGSYRSKWRSKCQFLLLFSFIQYMCLNYMEIVPKEFEALKPQNINHKTVPHLVRRTIFSIQHWKIQSLPSLLLTRVDSQSEG